MSNLAYIDDYKERFELIDGKIVMMSPRPRIDHRRALSNIFSEFRTYLKGKKCEALANDDKNKLTIYTDIKVSVCDDLTIKVKDIFENI